MSRPLIPGSHSIPESYSSLISFSHQISLSEIEQRIVSASSIVSNASSPAEFVASKIDHVSLWIEYLDELRKGLREAVHDGKFSVVPCKSAIEDVEKNIKPKELEIVMLKMQKKLIRNDLQETVPLYVKLEDAYTSIMAGKVMVVTAKQRKKELNMNAFKRRVVAFYGADTVPESDVGSGALWCHLTGWQAARHVKAAHIVPKSLESSELSYLFGAGEVMLSDANNGLTLERTVEEGFDCGKIVLIPLAAAENEETNWKCVLPDKAAGGDMILPGWRWKDFDGKQLKFLTPNRPARRYLYFRYIITYLHHKKDGNLAWVEDVETRGTMWATPGPYLRQSMLVSLARKVSDHFLPENFYEHNTFKEVEADESVTRPQEEAGMVLSLAYRLDEEKQAAVEKANDSDDSESDDDDDE